MNEIKTAQLVVAGLMVLVAICLAFTVSPSEKRDDVKVPQCVCSCPAVIVNVSEVTKEDRE